MIRWLTTRLWPRVWNLLKHWQDDDVDLLAASISYYAALSFFPLLLILISGLGLFLSSTGSGQDAQRRLLEFIGDQTSPTLARQVDEILAEVGSRAAISGPIGVLVLLFTAVTIFAQVDRAFQRIWHVPGEEPKGWIASALDVLLHRLTAFVMLLGVGALVVVNFWGSMVLAAIESAGASVAPDAGRFWRLLQIALSVALNWLSFTIVYKVLPRRTVWWREAVRGGIVASAIWELGRQLLAWLVIGEKYGAYGVIGSFIALLLWVYYASAVIFFGAEYVKVLTQERGGAAAADSKSAPAVRPKRRRH